MPNVNGSPMTFIDIIDAKDIGAHNETANTTNTTTSSVQDSPQQPAAASKQSHRTAKKSDTPYPLRRINKLKPGMKNYTLRARVIKKKHIGCQAVAVNLLDDSGKICAFINHEQVDKFSPLLEIDNVYHISQAQICKRKDQFKLVFTDDTTVEQYAKQCAELTDVSQERFDFISISLLEKYKEKQAVDILCIVADIIDAVPIVKGTGNGMNTRRRLMVVDKTGYKVQIPLWGHMAMDFGAPIRSVIAFKGAQVNSFDGRTLSAPEWRLMAVNPDFPTAHALRKWYDFEGCHMEFQSFSNTASTGKSTGDPGLQLVTVAGELLFGATANDIVKLQHQIDKVAFNKMFAAAKNKSYVFKCKITSVANELGTSKIATAIDNARIVAKIALVYSGAATSWQPRIRKCH